MELVYKEQLAYQDGYLVKDQKIVDIGWNIVSQYNLLDHALQRANYNEKNMPSPIEEPEPFVMESEHSEPIAVYPMTPLLDEKVKEGVQLLDELKEKSLCEQTGKIINEKFRDLAEWINAERVLVSVDPDTAPKRIDAPMLESILDFCQVDLIYAVRKCAEYGVFHDVAECRFDKSKEVWV